MTTSTVFQTKHDKRRLRGERTKRKILEAARHLFTSQGFHATTTRQITERAGVTPGAIYNHFQGKDAIFEAVLREYHPWKAIPQAVQAADGDTISDFVHDAARQMLRSWEQQTDVMRLHFIELIEFQGKHLPDLFGKNFAAMTTVLREKRKSTPALQAYSSATLGRAMLGLFFAYIMSDQFTGVPMSIGLGQNAFDYFTDIYLQGVLSQETETDKKQTEA